MRTIASKKRLNASLSTVVMAAMLLASCGGGGSSAGSGGGGTTVTPTPTPTGTTCSTADRQSFALATLQEWYLFPETLPTATTPAAGATVQQYIDALTANARAQGRDRYFTYITSIAEENAFFNSGASAGFGVRLASDATARRVFIMEAFEGAPALTAGIDRGDEILAIGTSASTMRTVSDIILAEGTAGVTNALGPSTAGTTRVLRVSGPSGTRDLTVAKSDYSLIPVSARYGAKILDLGGGRRVGYLNLRSFISSADQQLRDSFATFRAAGITEYIIDFRYNGGGLISTANLMGDLLGGNRSTSDVYSRTLFRPEKTSNDSIHNFAPTAQSVSPVKIAFIGTGSTASASELVINSMAPYLGNNLALVGANTYGKPVGQIAVDRAACDDRLRVIAFRTANAQSRSEYYTGLVGVVPNSCAAADDYTFPLGDPREASVAAAINFLSGGTCTPIAASAGQSGASATSGSASRTVSGPEMIIPLEPTAPQREVPGMF
jgi:C-terminal processing protease CtpA/Prc